MQGDVQVELGVLVEIRYVGLGEESVEHVATRQRHAFCGHAANARGACHVVRGVVVVPRVKVRVRDSTERVA